MSVVEREQRRISRDLHDGLGQQLTAISFMAQSLAHTVDVDANPEFSSELEALLAQISQASLLARTLAQKLHPVRVGAGQFLSAMQSLAISVQRFVSCRFESEGTFAPAGDADMVATQLYRIAQEAVDDAWRQRKATEVVISCLGKGEEIVFSISDNGPRSPDSSMEPAWETEGIMLRHRANYIAAQLEILPQSDAGTIVRVLVPKAGC